MLSSCMALYPQFIKSGLSFFQISSSFKIFFLKTKNPIQKNCWKEAFRPSLWECELKLWKSHVLNHPIPARLIEAFFHSWSTHSGIVFVKAGKNAYLQKIKIVLLWRSEHYFDQLMISCYNAIQTKTEDGVMAEKPWRC